MHATTNRDIALDHTQVDAIECQFRMLARRMLAGFPVVRRWEETDDIVQAAILRLLGSLQTCKVDSLLHLRRLCALQIRRQLLDLARKYGSPNSHAANYESRDGNPPSGSRQSETPNMEEWAEFHQCVATLPMDIRETFELIWYAGQTPDEAAEQLGISLRQCQRRWRTAKISIVKRVCCDSIFRHQ